MTAPPAADQGGEAPELAAAIAARCLDRRDRVVPAASSPASCTAIPTGAQPGYTQAV
jgi:hypothetical protein